MTLVVGATGLVGAEVCRLLKAAGEPVRAFVRPGSDREEELRRLGAEICHGDLKDLASVQWACRGQTRVVSTATATTSRRHGDSLATVDRDGNLALVEAARRAGVRRFVFVSVTPNATPRSAVTACKRAVEQRLRSSGMAWVNLQPSAFMEIWLSPRLGWDLARGRARIVGSGEQPISLVSAADVAAFCVHGVTAATLANRDVPLGGPEALTPDEIVKRLERYTGRPFRVRRVPLPVIRGASVALRPVNPVVAGLLAIAAGSAASGDRIDSSAVAGECGIRLTSLQDHVARTLGVPQV